MSRMTFGMKIECDTAEELAQALRMAADCVIATPGFFATLAVDESVDISEQPEIALFRSE